MPLVPRHDGRDNLIIDDPDKKQIRPHRHFPVNVLVRIISRTDKLAIPPNGNDSFLIRRLKCTNLHRTMLRLRTAKSKLRDAADSVL